MTTWYHEQLAQIASPPPYPLARSWRPARSHPPECPIEPRVKAAREELRSLHECGEVGWPDLNPIRVYEMAFLDD